MEGELELGTGMTRLRLAEAEATDDTRILEERKARRAELLLAASANPRPRTGFIATWFRGFRSIRTI